MREKLLKALKTNNNRKLEQLFVQVIKNQKQHR